MSAVDLGARLMQVMPDGRRLWVHASEAHDQRRYAAERSLSDQVMTMFGIEDGDVDDSADEVFAEVEAAEFAAFESEQHRAAVDREQRDRQAEKLTAQVDEMFGL